MGAPGGGTPCARTVTFDAFERVRKSSVRSPPPRSELASEVGASAFVEISCALVWSRELDRALAPSLGFTAKPLVLRVVELEQEEPCVRTEVELGAILAALDDQTSETGVLLNVVDDETGFAEGTVDGWNEPLNDIGRGTEEVEVAGLSTNVASGDQGGAAGECEPSASSRPAMISATCS